MTQQRILLQRYLECYGADTASWPQDASAWLEANRDASLESALVQEKRFEALLRSRSFAQPGGDLAQRIALAARGRRPQAARAGLALSLPIAAHITSWFRPSVLATVLALGFALGFNTFHQNMDQGTASLQSYADDEGAIL